MLTMRRLMIECIIFAKTPARWCWSVTSALSVKENNNVQFEWKI